ncbi:putative nucleic acid-binding, replication factor A [Helianthus anomalus]
MEPEKPTTTICTVVSIDHTDLHYTVCSLCERTLPDSLTRCNHCPASGSTPKRLFRVLMSVATDTNVFVVVLFDRAARVLFGCSAHDFFSFTNTHPFSGETVSRILEGEMLRVTLSNPRNGNAQHLRVVSVVPLRSSFRPVMDSLSELYGVRSSDR